MSVTQLGYFLQGALLQGASQGPTSYFSPVPKRRPLVSCVMPTRGHLFPARWAIECFLRQTYSNSELVVVCASEDSEVERYLVQLGHPRIRFFHALGAKTVGELRNRAIAHSEGGLVCVWDDDDLSHPRRIDTQVAGLQSFRSHACLLARELIWWPARKRMAISQSRLWENTMLAVREGLPPYPEVPRGGDTILVEQIRTMGRIAFIDHPASYCRTVHGANIWGAAHFEMLFSLAETEFGAQQYETAIRALAAEVPIRQYQQEFEGSAAPERPSLTQPA